MPSQAPMDRLDVVRSSKRSCDGRRGFRVSMSSESSICDLYLMQAHSYCLMACVHPARSVSRDSAAVGRSRAHFYVGRWRSWLSHLSNTQKVLSSSLGRLIFLSFSAYSPTNAVLRFQFLLSRGRKWVALVHLQGLHWSYTQACRYTVR